ncbi:MAG: hypothetical protein M3Y28_08435 [Armatimonadota bacterium]|nr:hypothetical protein [Armatimonadota bacterium]
MAKYVWLRTTLLAVLMLAGALFGADMAGLVCYSRDHAQWARTNRRGPDYQTRLNQYELLGGVAGSLPGLLLLKLTKPRAAKTRGKDA